MAVLLATLGGCGGRGGESADLQAFRATEGTRRYAIELDATVQGHMVETRTLDAGQPTIRTVTELELPGAGRTRRSETLTFADAPPHALLARRVETRTPDGRVHVRNDRDPDGAKDGAKDGAEDGAKDGAGGRHIDPGAAHGLRQQPGTRSAPDPAARRRLADHLGGLAAGDGTAHAPHGDDLVLAADGLPMEYRIGSSFLLRRVDDLPRLPGTRSPVTLRVPATARIGPRDAVDTLLLEISGPAAALLEAGPGLELRPASGRVRTHRLADATDDAASVQLIRTLIAAVRGRLRYVPGASPPDLEALLETGEGDCWEFAALFDALARRSGLDSRTVTGLAWMGDEAGAFGLHAWNEVRIDGRWLAVDATFDQLRADGARIRFPDDPAVQLDLQYALAHSTLKIVGVNGRAPVALSRRVAPSAP